MDISDKKTVLDDSASIYQKREEKSDRAKWKELKGFKAKWEHFKAYYLLKTFIWSCVAVLLVYAGYTFLKPKKEQVLYVAILDAVLMNNETEELQAGYNEYFGIDEETQESIFDNTMLISGNKNAYSMSKLMAHAFAGEIDVIIASESQFKGWAGVMFRPLSEQLPADLYEKLSDRFCYASPTDENGNVIEGGERPYGLYVTDLFIGRSTNKEPLVLGICGNSSHEKNAEEFVRYILCHKAKAEEE
ncbi:MAG: hypothetical protein J1E35_10675 [Lachnospiraceae bacterium]|nr:hypothetical protein [Lachnospiraceae bacterium]